ncbi:hypothetical protein R2X30_22620 [Citrobacter freundii]|uniref:hypothetical protein n=1 Tax=Citrobacter freundii TaxID=546 RepID=UPI0029551D29|nr:hypothetical protein [Citrobacter freundii]WOQ07836.1 hypothetical protein R2X30_22620 [Citrobacter freundii]
MTSAVLGWWLVVMVMGMGMLMSLLHFLMVSSSLDVLDDLLRRCALPGPSVRIP